MCVTAALFFLVLSVAAPSRAPKEFVLVEADAVNAKTVAAWKKERFSGVAAVADERFDAKIYQSCAKAADDGGLELYYWIEVGRNPRMAAEHPEWMASLGIHDDWLKRFPDAKPPGQGEVAKAFPWVSINYQEAFEAHLERIDRLVKVFPPNHAGVLLNDLQGGPSSCGCGNLQCRWATDYHVPATGAKFVDDDAGARFVAAVQRKIGRQAVVPVWATECDAEDLPREKRAGEWTTGYSGTVGCAVGTCPKVFTRQFAALERAHQGNVGILALHREMGRAFTRYGKPGEWIKRAVEYLDRTLSNNGAQAASHGRLWVVVQGYDVSKGEEKSARRIAAQTGASVVLVARARIDQSFEPRNVTVKK
ncbi:MAG: hypothetical protein E6L09_08555 [Verrucomicrobia bacterium]|nr:MAG: hypothetical protein E6L09_08555 [Verrucomicrobiota bacterium]